MCDRSNAIPALRRVTQEYCEFEASLDFIARLYVNKGRKVEKKLSGGEGVGL